MININLAFPPVYIYVYSYIRTTFVRKNKTSLFYAPFFWAFDMIVDKPPSSESRVTQSASTRETPQKQVRFDSIRFDYSAIEKFHNEETKWNVSFLHSIIFIENKYIIDITLYFFYYNPYR